MHDNTEYKMERVQNNGIPLLDLKEHVSIWSNTKKTEFPLLMAVLFLYHVIFIPSGVCWNHKPLNLLTPHKGRLGEMA